MHFALEAGMVHVASAIDDIKNVNFENKMQIFISLFQQVAGRGDMYQRVVTDTPYSLE